MMTRLALALALASPAAAAQGQTALRFEFGPPVFEPSAGSEVSLGACHAIALRKMAGGRVVWSQPLPDHARPRRYCACRRADGRPCGAEWREYTDPSTPLEGVLLLEERNDRVILALTGDLLLLDARTGQIVLDEPHPTGGGTYFDAGGWELGACRGDARGGRIVARCGDTVLLFDGARALVLGGRPLGVLARGVQRSTPAPHAGIEIEVPLDDGRVLRIHGAIHLR
ncbi:MAG: hypothetical protein M5U28_31160 [Sandaracinaceae bacterium]|nr:hypothetical protein [Sandaracinaceae bacterium]